MLRLSRTSQGNLQQLNNFGRGTSTNRLGNEGAWKEGCLLRGTMEHTIPISTTHQAEAP